MHMQKEKIDRVKLAEKIHDFVTTGVKLPASGASLPQKSNPIWQRMVELGSELWLDTGSISDATEHWTKEFTALTTNNTLLNKEVQTGEYDLLIREADYILEDFAGLSDRQWALEMAFVLNAVHGLRLVKRFNAYVSVEEHTALANTVAEAIEYGRRLYAVCPERFIIKIPFTPAGILAARKLSDEGIPVNHTLGFSARQNYVTARIARPRYVNVFLGRLNAFIADNALGDGRYVGEKAVLASEAAIKHLRQRASIPTRQIGASLRQGRQVHDLAGLDVMTIPPKIAGEFLSISSRPEKIATMTGVNYLPGIEHVPDPEAIRLNTLWEIDKSIYSCLEELEKEHLDSFTAADLVSFFHEHNCRDLFVRWRKSDIELSTFEGKIPKLENWATALEMKIIGLDSLMNLAGLCSFARDQEAMDRRIRRVVARKEAAVK